MKQILVNSMACFGLLMILLTSACSCKQSQQNQEKELITSDSLFSRLSMEKGMKNAFLAYLDSSAVLLRPNKMPIEGIGAVKRYFEGFSDTSYILTWKPIKAEISGKHGLGFTYGTYEIREKSTGKSNGRGTYATLWKKDSKGKWKAVFDSGNEGLGDSIR
jgi:ketosteroid isomerase-like protein